MKLLKQMRKLQLEEETTVTEEVDFDPETAEKKKAWVVMAKQLVKRALGALGDNRVTSKVMVFRFSINA